jgi:hypothetical protein
MALPLTPASSLATILSAWDATSTCRATCFTDPSAGPTNTARTNISTLTAAFKAAVEALLRTGDDATQPCFHTQRRTIHTALVAVEGTLAEFDVSLLAAHPSHLGHLTRWSDVARAVHTAIRKPQLTATADAPASLTDLDGLHAPPPALSVVGVTQQTSPVWAFDTLMGMDAVYRSMHAGTTPKLDPATLRQLWLAIESAQGAGCPKDLTLSATLVSSSTRESAAAARVTASATSATWAPVVFLTPHTLADAPFSRAALTLSAAVVTAEGTCSEGIIRTLKAAPNCTPTDLEEVLYLPHRLLPTEFTKSTSDTFCRGLGGRYDVEGNTAGDSCVAHFAPRCPPPSAYRWHVTVAQVHEFIWLVNPTAPHGTTPDARGSTVLMRDTITPGTNSADAAGGAAHIPPPKKAAWPSLPPKPRLPRDNGVGSVAIKASKAWSTIPAAKLTYAEAAMSVLPLHTFHKKARDSAGNCCAPHKRGAAYDLVLAPGMLPASTRGTGPLNGPPSKYKATPPPELKWNTYMPLRDVNTRHVATTRLQTVARADQHAYALLCACVALRRLVSVRVVGHGPGTDMDRSTKLDLNPTIASAYLTVYTLATKYSNFTRSDGTDSAFKRCLDCIDSVHAGTTIPKNTWLTLKYQLELRAVEAVQPTRCCADADSALADTIFADFARACVAAELPLPFTSLPAEVCVTTTIVRIRPQSSKACDIIISIFDQMSAVFPTKSANPN